MAQTAFLNSITTPNTQKASSGAPTFAIPKPGMCQVSCEVSKVGVDDGPVAVQVLMGDKVLASRGVSPSNSPQTITMSFSADLLTGAEGQCNVSNLTVQVVQGYPVACCSKPLPGTLQLRIKSALCASDVVIPLVYYDQYFFGSGPIPPFIREAWGACDSICGPFNLRMWHDHYDPVTFAFDWVCFYCYADDWWISARGAADQILVQIKATSVDCDKGEFTFPETQFYPCRSRFICPADGEEKQLEDFDYLSFQVTP